MDRDPGERSVPMPFMEKGLVSRGEWRRSIRKSVILYLFSIMHEDKVFEIIDGVLHDWDRQASVNDMHLEAAFFSGQEVGE